MLGERLTSCVGAVLFCMAVTFALSLAWGLEKMADQVCEYEHDADSQVERSRKEQVLCEPENGYEQIVAELMNDSLDYNVTIDDKCADTEEYNMTMIGDYLPLPGREYHVRCDYDSEGHVTGVEYYGE